MIHILAVAGVCLKAKNNVILVSLIIEKNEVKLRFHLIKYASKIVPITISFLSNFLKNLEVDLAQLLFTLFEIKFIMIF